MVRSDLIAFLLAVSSVFFAQESKAQEYTVEGNTLVDSNDNILYEIIEGSFTWQEAKVDAEFRGGHLATITSLEEQQTGELLTQGDFYWLGATDEQSEGVWEWVTGEPFDFTYWHNFLFNPYLSPEVKVLSFEPDWSCAIANPPSF